MTQKNAHDHNENQAKGHSSTENRGFASMDPEKQHEIASKGGKAAAEHGDTSKRGFASMDPEKQHEIASKGGKAAHEKGTAHEFTSEEAREAGRKGGQHSHGNRE
jgi:hypothetical protein